MLESDRPLILPQQKGYVIKLAGKVAGYKAFKEKTEVEGGTLGHDVVGVVKSAPYKVQGKYAQKSGNIVARNAFCALCGGQHVSQSRKKNEALGGKAAHAPKCGNGQVEEGGLISRGDKVGSSVNKKHTKAKQYRAYGYLVFSALSFVCLGGGCICGSVHLFCFAKVRPRE